ncbi:hypothetical protein D9757_005880 [Collybiopsis confluens]|uniref:Cytochrome P450 n=1 Tax=Collybiopsis confluens TaxID=2823264 RepID=A0A8H5HNW6_9AGAR|nr:hypothetical protein D9757_005880 [Collybiopsis confluens]
MHILLQLLSSIAATAVFYGLYTLLLATISRINSPFKDIPGPPNSHWFWGHMKDIIASDAGVLHEKWVEQYTKAINHILMNHFIYQKPEIARYNLTQLLGAGVLVTEEDKHKLQRKIMNPAFGPAQIRELTEIFIEKSVELRDAWMSEVSAAVDGVSKINVLNSLSEMTLDVIGLAGFNYKFNALNKTKGPSELKQAFSKIFGDPDAQRIRMWPFLQALIPSLRALPSQDAPGFKQAKATMGRIARELLRDSKASLQSTGEKDSNWSSRDLLSILVRSNMSGDPSQRMSDEDVLAQIPTFIVAGHETSSTATTWALFALAENADLQRKLRDELLALPTENPSMDELNSLSYLDKVVRETLRVHCPVPGTIRVATKDDIIPLGKPFVDAKGIERDHITIREGQTVYVPIININRDKTLWGEDAFEFKPDRWDNLPEAVSTIPGVWSHLLTFLGGARACIGYRFSLMEIKALLFILVRTFEFKLAVPREEIISKTTVVQRPRLKNDKEGGSQLPLLISVYQRP